MFKNVFSKIFGDKKPKPRPRLASLINPPLPADEPAEPSAGEPVPQQAIPQQTAPVRPATAPVQIPKENTAPIVLDASLPPETLCRISPEMTPDQIRDRLALLYRRHNRAASSLDAALRDEAEIMLEAVAVLREQHFGGPARSR